MGYYLIGGSRHGEIIDATENNTRYVMAKKEEFSTKYFSSSESPSLTVETETYYKEEFVVDNIRFYVFVTPEVSAVLYIMKHIIPKFYEL